jgi:hypothetical protein
MPAAVAHNLSPIHKVKTTLRLSVSFALMFVLAQEPASPDHMLEVIVAAGETMRGIKHAPVNFNLKLVVGEGGVKDVKQLQEDLTRTAITELQDAGWKFDNSDALLPSISSAEGVGFTVGLQIEFLPVDGGALWFCEVSVLEMVNLTRFTVENPDGILSQARVIIMKYSSYGQGPTDTLELSIKAKIRDQLDLLKSDFREQKERPCTQELLIPPASK